MPDKYAVLIAQYENALSLYMHEDQLNWQKFKHALYVNAALATVLGANLVQNLDWLIAGFGSLCSFLFSVTIINGRRYLIGRLDTAKIVEEKLQEHGAIYPLIDFVPGKKWIPKTGHAIIVFLWLLGFLWAFLSFYWGIFK